MKPLISTAGWVFLLFMPIVSMSQIASLPSVDIYTLDGSRLNASTLQNDGMPMILVFFKTSDYKCRENLFDICEAYENELTGRGVKLVAICIDCIGKTEHVKPFVLGHDLKAEVYVDKNGNLKRAMGVSDAPYTILYDQRMQIFCEYPGYCGAAGDLVCEKMKGCLNQMDLAY